MAFRFIHTADWQIGKPFAGVAGDSGAELRTQRIKTVGRIAELARERGVDTVLVASDAFDSNEVSDRTIHRAVEALRPFAGTWVFLLELARAQRVDLAKLSILDVAERFAAALEAAVARRLVPLTRLGDWLVMAAQLAWLRSRLLLPEDSREGEEGRREAEALWRHLADRGHVRRLADWLEPRPQLGRDVFARGAAKEPEGADHRGAASPPAADTAALLRACLAVLERPNPGGSWRPAPLPLWRVPDALARLRRMLPALPPEGAALERFLPEAAGRGAGGELQRKAALASTLLAGLELGREGAASLSQGEAFGDIVVAPAGRPESAHADPQAEVDLVRRPCAHLATS